MFKPFLRPPLVILAAMLAMPAFAQATFVSPLDTPSLHSAKAIQAPINALAKAGGRLIAAGQRGHILYSDDATTWRQAQVPVSSDLTALAFPSATQGWAVGHEGVVLHSNDAGQTWTKQLDGRQIATILLKQFGNPANPDDPEAQRLKQDAELFATQGADKPLLDVWFADARTGFVTGAFNLILRTEDGGQTWTAWQDRVENPRSMHLYGLRPAAGTLFMVAEQGLVLKLDADSQRFVKVELPYEGTLFGLLGDDRLVLVYGLRGNALRSLDGGASWSTVDTGISEGITSGLIADDGSILLASQTGQLLRSNDRGATFRRIPVDRVAPNFALAPAADGAVALAGLGGVRVQSLQQNTKAGEP
ncbi:glycosyl hydrolase [Pseudomonas sp. JQ170]|uniref:WD40/YVTN/BNR-like repeat-containing protein n=1 Tax=unclassified Pseudomonas TaxID=196821 RepID=UPI0026511A23|nr:MULTISPECIES: YCF48-related protein [unclassified Pseudomonas]MDN7139740.1 glycosyl hydrolase [Pseudomonas sp. JQ170]WRO73806.1 YCF48-related protein [Pseudomonas sp. 170C]